MENYLIIDAERLTKFFRKKPNNGYFFVSVSEQLPFGKAKVNLFYDDKYYPYFRVNYIGTTVVELKHIKEAEQSLYKIGKII